MTRRFLWIDPFALALPLLISLSGVISCGSDERANDSASADHESSRDKHGDDASREAPGVVVLSAEKRARAGIEVATVGPAAIDSGIEFLGEVHPNGDRLAHIVPRFPGIVRELSGSLAERGVSIEELETHVSSAAMAGGDLFKVKALLAVPASLPDAELRRELLQLFRLILQSHRLQMD